MSHNYEEIVYKWYNRLRPSFLQLMLKDFSYLTLYDAENIYQDAFLAIRENLKDNRVKEDTSWQNYIMRIGINLALKEYRKKGHTVNMSFQDITEDRENGHKIAKKVESIIKELPEEEGSFYKNEEVQSILGEQLMHLPEPCSSIIRLFYYEDFSMEKIAEEIGYKNAATAKSKKSRCMKGLIERLTKELREAGFFVTPKKRSKNGKD